MAIKHSHAEERNNKKHKMATRIIITFFFARWASVSTRQINCFMTFKHNGRMVHKRKNVSSHVCLFFCICSSMYEMHYLWIKYPIPIPTSNATPSDLSGFSAVYWETFSLACSDLSLT